MKKWSLSLTLSALIVLVFAVFYVSESRTQKARIVARNLDLVAIGAQTLRESLTGKDLYPVWGEGRRNIQVRSGKQSSAGYSVEFAQVLAGIPLAGQAFDTTLVVGADGQILEQQQPAEIQFASARQLRPFDRQAKKFEDKMNLGEVPMAAAMPLKLGDNLYELFCQPVRLPEQSKASPDKNSEPVSGPFQICGLVSESRLTREAWDVPFLLAAGCCALLLLCLLVPPYLRVHSLGRRQRLRLLDVLGLGGCSLLGLALLTVFSVGLGFYYDVKHRVKAEVKALAVKASQQLVQELTEAARLVNEPSQSAQAPEVRLECPRRPVCIAEEHAACGASLIRSCQSASFWGSTAPGKSLIVSEVAELPQVWSLAWISQKDGVQTWKRTFESPAVAHDVSERPYFQRALRNRDSLILNDIRSKGTGEVAFAMSRFLGVPCAGSADKTCAEPGVLNLTMRPNSLRRAALPDGVSMLLANAKGDVLFHSENFGSHNLLSATHSEELRRLFRDGHAGAADVKYWGVDHLASVSPLPLLGEQLDQGQENAYFIVALEERSVISALILEAVIPAILPCGLVLGGTVCFVLLLLALCRDPLRWVSIEPRLKKRYTLLAAAYAVLLLILLWAGLTLQGPALEPIALGVPCAALGLTIAFFTFPSASPRSAAQGSAAAATKFAFSENFFLSERRAVPVLAGLLLLWVAVFLLLDTYGLPASALFLAGPVIALSLAAPASVLKSRPAPLTTAAAVEPQRLDRSTCLSYAVMCVGFWLVVTVAPVAALATSSLHAAEDAWARVRSARVMERHEQREREIAGSLNKLLWKFAGAETSAPVQEQNHKIIDAWVLRAVNSSLPHRSYYPLDNPPGAGVHSPEQLALASQPALGAQAMGRTTHFLEWLHSLSPVISKHAPKLRAARTGAESLPTFAGLKPAVLERPEWSLLALLWGSTLLTVVGMVCWGMRRLLLVQLEAPEQQTSEQCSAVRSGRIIYVTVLKSIAESLSRSKYAGLVSVAPHLGDNPAQRAVQLQRLGVAEWTLISAQSLRHLKDIAARKQWPDGELTRWLGVLRNVRVIYVTDSPVSGSAAELELRELARTLAGNAAGTLYELAYQELAVARTLFEAVLAQYRGAALPRVSSEAELMLRIRDAAWSYYLDLWLACSDDERLILLQLAEEGFINPRQADVVRELLGKGLIVRRPALALFNQSFAAFVRSQRCEAQVQAWENEKGRFGWLAFRTPLLVVAGAAASVIYFIFPSLYEQAFTFIAAVATGAIPLVARAADALFSKKNLAAASTTSNGAQA